MNPDEAALDRALQAFHGEWKLSDETKGPCLWCGDLGWVYDYEGSCGNSDCCPGIKEKMKCERCENDWSENE